MMRRPFANACVATALLILPVLSGCVFQKKVSPPVVATAPPPAPVPMPLYTSELAEADDSLPKLPPAPPPVAQPAPPPESQVQLVKKRISIRPRGRKESETAERTTREPASAHDKQSARGSAVSSAAENSSTRAKAPAASSPDNVAKVTAKPPAGDNSTATPIGQLTAGPGQDAPQSRKEAADLIQNTERGVTSLHRGLSGDESKTVTQIHSFLQQAMHALHNGDVDGAFTLATKAKVLLTELTDSE